MAKQHTIYSCQSCGAQYPKWSGQCGQCSNWNCLVEEIASPLATNPRYQGYAISTPEITLMSTVTLQEHAYITTGLKELDRVLGGGLIPGSAVLIGGDPGIGKSTLLLQTVCFLSQHLKVLYVTGEESLQQVTLRARRLGLPEKNLLLLADTHIEHILKLAREEKPGVIVVDSIQTMHTDLLQSAPGAVGQVRESAAQLVNYAKQTQTALFLVGHVTKEGALAGPRVLEHMVDTVLYFEGEPDNRYRVIRAVKNRFGAVNELGIFAMTDKGLKEVNNPSAIFLSRYTHPVPGSVIMATKEGSRPLLVEIQALLDQSYMGNPRRVCVGLEAPRLSMLLAVLHRHTGIATHDQDVFVNAVGGMRITETGADLALVLAVLSSLRNKAVPPDVIVFGELGLAGEIRPIQGGQERLREAEKHGFKFAIVPHANLPKTHSETLKIFPVQTLMQAVDVFKNLVTETNIKISL
ncbi:DNA repair protein RadA [Gammaproteobacteria bacterium SCGC AG-212-F23]|nr:DNA repair protein RadA [Gammaproteobacteria bacterium SCGC AG-212-F23]